MADNAKPNLGLATTEQLFRELIARFMVHSFMVERACQLSEMLGGLGSIDKEYTTYDGVMGVTDG